MDEDEMFEAAEWPEIGSARMGWADAGVLFFGACGDLLTAASNICRNVSNAFAMHANYKASQDAMRDRVHMDLESLPLTKEDGDER